MLTYRGDKFIKGKKFTIKESVYRFQKRDNKDNLIFEGVKGDKLKLTEEEFNKSVTLKEEANGYSEPYMISVIKSYYEDGNKEDRDMANMFISTYAIDDKYPELQKYVKELLNKEHSKENTSEEHNPFDVGSAIKSVANEYGVQFESKTPFDNFYAPDSDGEDEDDLWYSNEYDWASFYDKILHDLGYGENPVLNDLRAEVHEVSDGKYEMHLMLDNKLYTVDLRAWDKLEDVKNNVEDIINLLSK